MKKLTLACLVAAALIPAVVSAHQAGDIIVRAGAISVQPHESSSDVVLGGTTNLGEFSVNNNTQVGLTGTYMITDNIAVELLAATPFSHKVSLAGLGNIAKAKHLPPSLMVQYYLFDKETPWRPYAGVGVNYTNFFSEKFTQELNLHDLKLKDSWGVVGQVGMDYILDNNLVMNAAVWWMDIDTKVRFKDASGNQYSVKTDIDPWVFMVGVGYKF